MFLYTYVILLLQALFALSNGGSRKYRYFPDLKTWSEAQSYCRENYVDLATIESEEEWVQVQLILQNVNLEPWIGLYDDYTSWRWSLDNTYLYQDSNTPFGNWMSFNIDDYYSNEHCGGMIYGNINDDNCAAPRYLVCYDEATNSYFNISTAMSWLVGQAYCRQNYTDLTSIRSQQEWGAIMEVIDFDLEYWIGLSRESWKWSDQSKFSFNNWAPNEGINALGEEYCACTRVSGFVDDRCDQTRPFLCTVSDRVMKTFKIEFKPVSPINLDDPVAQDSLLQNLETEFKEMGIHQNFTLSWRKQANGKCFNIKET